MCHLQGRAVTRVGNPVISAPGSLVRVPLLTLALTLMLTLTLALTFPPSRVQHPLPACHPLPPPQTPFSYSSVSALSPDVKALFLFATMRGPL